MSSFTEQSAQKYLDKVKNTDNIEARDYLLRFGYNSSSFDMPEYYGASGLQEISLEPIDWKKGKKPKITKPLNFLTPKGYLSWRNFSLLHPYIYVHIVNEMTRPESWEMIRRSLSRKCLVHCYSTPQFNAPTKSNGVRRWLNMAEKDLIRDSVRFNYLTITDIKNFYPSIYTHSISWAIHGKEMAKTKRRDNSLLGNKLDRLFQNARDGQTNGIPVGSMVSDITAEIVLKDVDVVLSKLLNQQKIADDVLITRYRDDYRILSKTEEQGALVLRNLSRVLDEYNLTLNSEKTRCHDDIIEGSFREWSREVSDDYLLRPVRHKELDKRISATLLKDILLKIYKLQKTHPHGRSSITLLSHLTEHLNLPDVTVEINKVDIHTVISILRKLSLIREDASAQTYLLLDNLMKKLNDEEIKAAIINELLEAIKDDKDRDYQVIWLFRLCLSNSLATCDEIFGHTESPLIELLKDETWGNYIENHYEIFPEITGVSEKDKNELQKFSYVDVETFASAAETAIDREFYDIFKY